MARQTTPLDMVHSGMQLSRLMWQTQMVISMRMMGMAGAWDVAPTENNLMASEKAPAFAKAATAASVAAMTGKRPDEVLNAWTGSLGRKTGANYRRLSRRGPKIGF